jgi:hypothetical protein
MLKGQGVVQRLCWCVGMSENVEGSGCGAKGAGVYM